MVNSKQLVSYIAKYENGILMLRIKGAYKQ